MLEVVIENKYGQQLNLTASKDYDLIRVTGLLNMTALINTSANSTQDGTEFNSSRLNERDITMLIVPKGSVENARVNLYKYIRPKQPLKMYFKNNLREVYILGYIYSTEGDLYENPQKIQANIICPDPYFKSINKDIIKFSNVVDDFIFPFCLDSIGKPMGMMSTYTQKNIYNSSDDETGIIIELYASNTVLKPTIYNQTTNEHFTVDYELSEGDKLILNTCKGEKSLKLMRNGVEINIINNMVKGSNWFNLVTGDNIFSYTCEYGAEHLQATMILQPIFGGI